MRNLALVAAVGLAASCGSTRPAAFVEPSHVVAPGPSGVPAAGSDERTADDAAYRFLYLPAQKHLTESHRGDWLAIVAGQVVPASGTQPSPVKTMEEADAAARSAAPDAKHRFIFRIGEEGDADWPMGGCELQHVVGTGFLKALYADVTQLRMDKGLAAPIEVKFGGEFREITVKGPDDRTFVKPEIGAPGAGGAAREIYCVSTGFGGNAVLAPATAAAAGLDLWEIPGTVRITERTADGIACRRARARMRWSGSSVDFTLPVAIWPK